MGGHKMIFTMMHTAFYFKKKTFKNIVKIDRQFNALRLSKIDEKIMTNCITT